MLSDLVPVIRKANIVFHIDVPRGSVLDVLVCELLIEVFEVVALLDQRFKRRDHILFIEPIPVYVGKVGVALYFMGSVTS